jgi:hypothetical protein
MINKRYFISVSLMMVVIPVVGFIIQHATGDLPLSFQLFGKWFIFSAAGLRLLLAGLQQSLNPAFTAKEIFHIDNLESHPIVRELGFANICFGIVGIVSFFKSEWRIVSAFASGIYYGLAALQHIIKKPVGANEAFALVTDIMIFGVLAAYLWCFWI